MLDPKNLKLILGSFIHRAVLLFTHILATVFTAIDGICKWTYIITITKDYYSFKFPFYFKNCTHHVICSVYSAFLYSPDLWKIHKTAKNAFYIF